MANKAAKYVIVRTYSAGYLRAIWLVVTGKKSRSRMRVGCGTGWRGVLSQMAVSGTSKPKGCKFPVAVPSVTLTEAIEILDVTPEAETSIKAVPVWKN